jgi:hypothetical protein
MTSAPSNADQPEAIDIDVQIRRLGK